MTDYDGIFRIGVATSNNPQGPFIPEADFIPGTYSIDPSVFLDGDMPYMILGGIWGGQLERWQSGTYKAEQVEPEDNEAAWIHEYNDMYYLSYSTGSTHYIVYATSDRLEGPYTYQGKILDLVLGWTSHHSIVEFQDTWYLFYYDASLSCGIDHQRSMMYVEMEYEEDGSIKLIKP